MPDQLTKSRFKDIVRDVLREQYGRPQPVRSFQERIQGVIDNFDLPPDPETFLQKLHDEIGKRFDPGDEVTRAEIARVVESPEIWRCAANVNFRDFIDWVWEKQS